MYVYIEKKIEKITITTTTTKYNCVIKQQRKMQEK